MANTKSTVKSGYIYKLESETLQQALEIFNGDWLVSADAAERLYRNDLSNEYIVEEPYQILRVSIETEVVG